MKKVLALLMILLLCVGLLPAQALAMELLSPNPFFDDLSVTPTIPHIYSGETPVPDTGVMSVLVRWKNNSAMNDVESFMNSKTAGGEDRKIEENNTRPRNGTSGIEDDTGWAFLTGSDGYNTMRINVPILGRIDRNSILNTVQSLLTNKITGEGAHISPSDVFNSVNGVLQKIEINGNKPEEMTGETTGGQKLVDLLNNAIDRAHEDGNPNLTDAEKQQVTDIVTGAMGTGYAPQAGAAEGDKLSVQLFGLVQTETGDWQETDFTKPIEFEVAVENDGKTFTNCDHAWVWYNTDDVSHYQYCSKCEAMKEGSEGAHTWTVTVNTPATCTADAKITKTCSVCSRVNTSHKPDPATDAAELFAHHVWKETWDHNTVVHWQTCSVCGIETEHKDHSGYTNVKVVTPRTCTENASVTATCGICGANVTLVGNELKTLNNPDYLASGHDFSGPLKFDKSTCTAEGEGNHAPSCVNCGIRDSEHAVAHTWTGLHNVSNGTCGDPNDPVIQEAACECGAKLHMEKPREHVPVADTSQDVQPTCTEPGKINGKRCTICGVFYDYEAVEALGHDFVKDDEKKADCATEGFIHYTCSRCKEEKTETIEKMSANGQHTWVKKVGLAPSCLTEGTYDGEICEVCKAERKPEGDYGKLEALGHKVHAETAQHGRVKNKVSLSGTPMDITTYLTIYSCTRCGERLGSEYWTVATASASAGAATNGAKYEIVSGRNAEITDMQNGIHVNGNMADDGGVQFNGTVLDALNEVIEGGKSKYQYKKVKANSFIIEFTDEFLAEIADGTYKVEIINGSEYWPMLATVKDHKLESLEDMEIPDAPEMTGEQFDALIKEQTANGGTVKELFIPSDRDATLEHLWDDGKVTKEPTCTEKGVKTFTCTVCKETRTEEIAAKGHTEVVDAAVAATCTADGKTAGSHCSVCNAVIKAQEVVKAAGHKWDEGKVTTEATCAKEGVKTFTCTVCNETKTEPIAKATEHAYGAWEVTKAATAAAAGEETRTCTVCGNQETRTTEKLSYMVGDVDGDGFVKAEDARLALRRSVNLETYPEGTAQYLACDADFDKKVTPEDARLILRASVGLEDASKWQEKLA